MQITTGIHDYYIYTVIAGG